MIYPLAFLGLAAQVPLQTPLESPVGDMVDDTPKFGFREGSDIFSPKDLVCKIPPPLRSNLTVSDFDT